MDNMNQLPFALDYGLQNGPILLAEEMTNEQFVDFLTNPKFDYDYTSSPAQYETKSFWQEISDNTTSLVDQSTGFVWDTATGTWESIKAGATEVANAVSDAGSKIIQTGTGLFDSILMRIVLVFVILVAGLYLLGKAGVISDVAKVFVAKG